MSPAKGFHFSENLRYESNLVPIRSEIVMMNSEEIKSKMIFDDRISTLDCRISNMFFTMTGLDWIR